MYIEGIEGIEYIYIEGIEGIEYMYIEGMEAQIIPFISH